MARYCEQCRRALAWPLGAKRTERGACQQCGGRRPCHVTPDEELPGFPPAEG